MRRLLYIKGVEFDWFKLSLPTCLITVVLRNVVKVFHFLSLSAVLKLFILLARTFAKLRLTTLFGFLFSTVAHAYKDKIKTTNPESTGLLWGTRVKSRCRPPLIFYRNEKLLTEAWKAETLAKTLLSYKNFIYENIKKKATVVLQPPGESYLLRPDSLEKPSGHNLPLGSFRFDTKLQLNS